MILNLKNSRNIIITVLFLGFSLFSTAQELSKVNFKISPQTTAINAVVFTIGELSLQFDPKANSLSLLNRGSKKVPEWSDYLDEEYYDDITDGGKRGKIRSIGGVKIDYFDVFDGERNGKIKSFGGIRVDYYDVFDGERRGKIKLIGSHSIGYYDVFDGNRKGKLKSFGPVKIDYYDNFSGAGKSGKLSSIGAVRIDYHDNFSPAVRSGKIKSIKGNTPNLYVTIDRGNKMYADPED